MASVEIKSPFETFRDVDGSPLDDGYVYIGTLGLDPITNPINVYWDFALTIPATQPIRTISGLPSRAGAPSQLFCSSSYSIVVKDKVGSVVNNSSSIYGPNTDLADTSNIALGDALVGVKAPFTGAVARTQHAKNAETISILDMDDITGNGTADDTTGFIALIAAAQPGWTINLHGLTIALTANSVVMTSKTDLKFVGHGATIKLLDPTTGTDPFILTMVTCSDITFEGITFDAQVSTAAGNNRRAVWVKSGSDITFQDCDFSKCRDGVYTGTGAGVGPSRVLIRRCRQVAELAFTAARADTDLSLPKFLGNFVYGGADSIVEDCYCYGVGIPVYSEEGLGIKVLNNTFDTGWDSQVYLKGERSHITGNRIYNAGKDGIKILNTGANNAWRSVISNNHIEKFAMTRTDGSVGIHVQGRHHVITGNLIALPTHAEAAGTGTLNCIIIGASYVNVSGNVLYGNASDAYQVGVRIYPVQASIRDIQIANNTFTGHQLGIVSQTTALMNIDKVHIANNLFSGYLSRGINSTGNTTGFALDWTITGNHFVGGVGYCIAAENITSMVISGNTASDLSSAAFLSNNTNTLMVIANNVTDTTPGTFIDEVGSPTYTLKQGNYLGAIRQDSINLKDGMTAPGASITGVAQIYVDTSDGDLKVRFADGTVKVIVADT